MLDRRLISNFDFGLLFLALLFAFIGEGAIYSASHFAGGAPSEIYVKQLYWIGLGVVLLLVTISINYQSLRRYAYLFYAVSLFLLVLVEIKGKIGMGAQRWLEIGPLTLQPSEVMKLALVLTLARYISDMHERGGGTLKRYLVMAGLIALPLLLILKQPDLGTTLMLLAISLTLVFISGMPVKPLIFAGIAGLTAAPFLWRFLKDYQKLRILVFLKPDLDPSGYGYHITQSKIAIGSGELFGKGILQGTQSQLRFLPEQHTDFIFSVIAEETGFLGTLVLILLFAYLVFKGINIAIKAHDLFGTLVAAGITTMIAYYIFINIGMTSGIFPVVGVPLPFISYGGSHLVTLFIGSGLILNVGMRRFQGG
ncbi:MAG: rod shape-determining protein RodA [bacterium]|nr:rod shape-determining protein RodA [bacterium]